MKFIKSKAIHCDCIDGLRKLTELSVSCVVTSPPYNIGIKYNTYSDNRPDYYSWLKEVFIEVKRTLKDDGHFFLQMGGMATNPLIPWRVLQQALDAGFILQNEIIWVKNITVGTESHGQFKPLNTNRFLNNTHEYIFHLTKSGKVPIDKLAVGVSFKWLSNVARFKHKNNLRCRGNVWYIPYKTIQTRGERFNHPAIFPIDLPKMCIQLSGISKGSLVLDPFVGTGATLLAGESLEMLGLGFDLDATYVEVANTQLRNLRQSGIQNIKAIQVILNICKFLFVI